jgi:hypothetical protein
VASLVIIALRTVSGLNAREHWRKRAKRVRMEREVVQISLYTRKPPPLPCTITLTRCAPSRGLDGDNLQGALKAVRDQVAVWLGCDDRDPRVEWRYEQQRSRRGVWQVLIGF